jgi:hypothetical protein
MMQQVSFIRSGCSAMVLFALVHFAPGALAQDRRTETLIVANEFGPNSLDIHAVGANPPNYSVP